MSKVLDAQPAASSPAPSENLTALPVSPVRERISALQGEDLTHYRNTGELPEDKTPAAASSPALDTPTQTPDPSSDAVKPPDSAPDDDPQEPISERSKRREEKNKLRFDALTASNGQLKAELELVKKQLAEGTAPKTPTTETLKADALTKPPRLKDFPDTPAGVEQWEEATLKWQSEEIERRIEARLNRERATTETARTNESWSSQLKASESAHPDFAEIADKAPLSAVGIEILKAHPQGTEILYFLGRTENAEEAMRILQDTDIDGLSYAELRKAQNQPAIKARTLTALGIARAELNAIGRSLKAAPPKKEPVTSGKLPPSSTVTVPAKGTSIGDPIAEALARKDGSYIKLMNEQERRELKNR